MSATALAPVASSTAGAADDGGDQMREVGGSRDNEEGASWPSAGPHRVPMGGRLGNWVYLSRWSAKVSARNVRAMSSSSATLGWASS